MVFIVSSSIFSQSDDTENEIKRIRKELMQVQDERKRVVDEVKKDKTDFDAYRKRTLERMRVLRLETDSTKQSIIAYANKKDSVDAVINAEKSNTRRYEILQSDYRSMLISASDSVTVYVKTMPPLVSGRILSSLKLLRDELVAATVDNNEATTRLAQICKDIHEQGGTIQIVQGTSPIPDIRGTTYSIRVGAIFEAVVNAQGTQSAVWNGFDEKGFPQWELIKDPLIAQSIFNAVNVREGKSLPALVELPFTNVPVVKGE